MQMRSMSRFTTLTASLAATLAPASPALAKGGGGGGGSCASIDSLTVDATATGRALDAVVTMNCLDEHSGAVAFDSVDPDTGATIGRAVIMSNLGTRTYSLPLGAARTRFTVTVYAPNGKVQDTRSITV